MLMTRKSHLLLRLAVCGGEWEGFVSDGKGASVATSGGMKRQRKHQQYSKKMPKGSRSTLCFRNNFTELRPSCGCRTHPTVLIIG